VNVKTTCRRRLTFRPSPSSNCSPSARRELCSPRALTVALEPYRKKLNVFSGLRVPLDSKPNGQHWSGLAAAITGIAPFRAGEFESKTIDQQVAEVIGKGVRFRSVAASSSGDPKQSYSSLGGANLLPSEAAPLSLYTRLFGLGFQDPTKGDWKPDPRIMLQKSVLSAVAEDRKRVMQNLSTGDRARMDQYFTSVREMEEQLAVQLQPPAKAEACVVPKQPDAFTPGTTWEDAIKMHDSLTDLLVMALACNQTRVFHLALSTAVSNVTYGRPPSRPVPSSTSGNGRSSTSGSRSGKLRCTGPGGPSAALQ